MSDQLKQQQERWDNHIGNDNDKLRQQQQKMQQQQLEQKKQQKSIYHSSSPSSSLVIDKKTTYCDIIQRSHMYPPPECRSSSISTTEKDDDDNTVVQPVRRLLITGMGRSGTTMMQQMLKETLMLRLSHDNKRQYEGFLVNDTDGAVSWVHAFRENKKHDCFYPGWAWRRRYRRRRNLQSQSQTNNITNPQQQSTTATATQSRTTTITNGTTSEHVPTSSTKKGSAAATDTSTAASVTMTKITPRMIQSHSKQMRTIPFLHVIHLVRDPLHSISSRYNRGKILNFKVWNECNTASMQHNEVHNFNISTDIDDDQNLDANLVQTLQHYVLWNSFIESYAKYRIQIENINVSTIMDIYNIISSTNIDNSTTSTSQQQQNSTTTKRRATTMQVEPLLISSLSFLNGTTTPNNIINTSTNTNVKNQTNMMDVEKLQSIISKYTNSKINTKHTEKMNDETIISWDNFMRLDRNFTIMAQLMAIRYGYNITINTRSTNDNPNNNTTTTNNDKNDNINHHLPLDQYYKQVCGFRNVSIPSSSIISSSKYRILWDCHLLPISTIP